MKKKKNIWFLFGQEYLAKIKGNRILFDLYNITENKWVAIQRTWYQ